MVISPWWAQIAILTFLAGFIVPAIMAHQVYTQHPPIPEKVVDEAGAVVFTGRDIQSGQQVFCQYGLMRHGTIFGHGALMGVCGMLAMGFLVFVARYFIPADHASNWAMGSSFWGLNIGLAYMIFVNLVPVGWLQFRDSLENGYWHARSPEFYAQSLVRALEWARLPGDVIFIVLGILSIMYLALRTFYWRNRPATVGAEKSAGEFVTSPS